MTIRSPVARVSIKVAPDSTLSKNGATGDLRATVVTDERKPDRYAIVGLDEGWGAARRVVSIATLAVTIFVTALGHLSRRSTVTPRASGATCLGALPEEAFRFPLA
jgi:hypothetical protein